MSLQATLVLHRPIEDGRTRIENGLRVLRPSSHLGAMNARPVAVSLLALSCGGSVAVDAAPDAGPKSASTTTVPSTDREALHTVQGIVHRSPQLAWAYANGGELSAAPKGFVSSGDRAVDRGDFEKLAARIPRFADEALEVDIARIARLRIKSRRL
jgi:hypothetical protein